MIGDETPEGFKHPRVIYQTLSSRVTCIEAQSSHRVTGLTEEGYRQETGGERDVQLAGAFRRVVFKSVMKEEKFAPCSDGAQGVWIAKPAQTALPSNAGVWKAADKE